MPAIRRRNEPLEDEVVRKARRGSVNFRMTRERTKCDSMYKIRDPALDSSLFSAPPSPIFTILHHRRTCLPLTVSSAFS